MGALQLQVRATGAGDQAERRADRQPQEPAAGGVAAGGQVQESPEEEHDRGQGQAEDGQEAQEEDVREAEPQDGVGGEPEQDQQENQDGVQAEEAKTLRYRLIQMTSYS